MIRKALLLPGSSPVGIGITGAQRGVADTGDETIAVIWKPVPTAELAAELFCAVLARELALPAPEPFLLFDPVEGRYLFGSADLEYPNSLRRFNVNPSNPSFAAVAALKSIIVGWSRAREVAAFDEWIHNRDRNLGNLLYVTNDEFAIIDHGKSLDVDPSYPTANTLCSILADECADPRALRSLLKSMQRVAAAFDMMHAESPYASLQATGQPEHVTLAEEFYKVVEDRLNDLPTLLNNRLPGQHGLLISS